MEEAKPPCVFCSRASVAFAYETVNGRVCEPHAAEQADAVIMSGGKPDKILVAYDDGRVRNLEMA